MEFLLAVTSMLENHRHLCLPLTVHQKSEGIVPK